MEEVIMACLRWAPTVGTGCALLLSAGTLPLLAQTPPPIRFDVPAVVDPIHTNGEPDIGIDPFGRVFVSGPTGTGTQRSVWLGSVDRGHTFRIISPGLPPSAIAGIIDPPGGGDTDINFDRSGKQYFADLYALACLRTATTTDGGATVNQEIYPAGCSSIPGADRQWLEVYDPAPGTPNQSAYTGPRPLIYMEFNNLVGPGPNGGAEWTRSTDGLTYVHALDAPTSAGNGPNYANLVHIADNLPGSPDTLFTVLSFDTARNLFVTWTLSPTDGDPTLRQTFVSVASAASGWRNWSAPVQVSSSPSMVSVFPWMKAGGPGRADVVWYGSNLSVDPSSQKGQSWDVFMSQVVYPVSTTGAATGAGPSVAQVRVTPHPMHYNDICLAGSGCIASQGNRNLADFFAVTIDHTGAAEIVYDDTSNGLAQPGFTSTGNQTVDHAGAGVITLARQSSGPGLFGTNVSGPSNAPTIGITGNFGDALFPVIGGTNVPGMDILSNSISLSGNTLTVTTRIVDLSNPAATAARIAGTAFLQYVTRWQMGNTIYYGAMENTSLNRPIFYAGKAQSVDLCSVSACFPHVITYPEPGLGGSRENGSINCPSVPSASNPCTLTINVNVADVGHPTSSSLLEEVGSYSFASAHQSGATTNPQAEADNVPLEIDGVCCYNTRPQPPQPTQCRPANGNGHVPGKNSGEAQFNFHQDDCGLQPPSAAFTDPNSGVNFQSAQMTSVTYDDVGHTVTILGTGTDNGSPVAFTIVAAGTALMPPGMFSFTLSDGYINSGNLLDGTIELQ